MTIHQRSSKTLYNILTKYHSPKRTLHSFSSKPLSTFHNSTIPSKPTSKIQPLTIPTFSNFNLRPYSNSTTPTPFDKDKVIDEINIKFAEAREEIEAAMDSKETVYFNEEAECAKAAVKEVLDLFDGLLGKVDGKEREAILRSMGLKIEQLKAEFKQLEED